MSLLTLWKSNPAEFEAKQIGQLVALAGERARPCGRRRRDERVHREVGEALRRGEREFGQRVVDELHGVLPRWSRRGAQGARLARSMEISLGGRGRRA